MSKSSSKRPTNSDAGSVISESFQNRDKRSAEFDVVHISGYLLKKSSGGEWQRRYFETNGSFLTYYKSQKMTKLLAALSLPQVGKIVITGEIEDSLGKGVIIQLELKDREYTLRALTQKEAQKWVDVLTALRDGTAGSGSMATAGAGGDKAMGGPANAADSKIIVQTEGPVSKTKTLDLYTPTSNVASTVAVKDMSAGKDKRCGCC